MVAAADAGQRTPQQQAARRGKSGALEKWVHDEGSVEGRAPYLWRVEDDVELAHILEVPIESLHENLH